MTASASLQGRQIILMKKVLCLILFCFLISCCVPASFAEMENHDLVIAVYMTGSDLESNGGAASEDLREMMRFVPADQNVRILAMVSGSSQWELDIPTDATSIYEITRDGLLCIQKEELKNMGDPETMAEFLSFAEERYPAAQYGLIIWDHGAGPLAGVCFDELFKTDGASDRLTLEELNSALNHSPFSSKKLSFIGFDACLMCTLEVAATVAPYADYMIASQETEPPEGWNYEFLKDLTGNERGDQIGESILHYYEESMRDIFRPVTLSCLDLSKTDEVCATLGSFFSQMDAKITDETYRDYTRCRSKSKTLGNTTTTSYDLVDLMDLISLYEDEHLADSSEITDALKSMIVSSFSANEKYVNGISIYYPFDNIPLYESSWSVAYGRLSFIPEYQLFIKKVSNIYIGEALLNWKSDYQLQLQQDAGTFKLSVNLSPEEMNNLTRYRLIVSEELRGNAYQHIYVDYNNPRLLSDKIVCTYHGEALYLINEKGEILGGPITYYPYDEGIAVYGILYYDFDPVFPFESQKIMDPVQLIYHQDEDGHLIFTDAMVIADDNDENGRLRLPSAVDFSQSIELDLYNAGPRSDVTSLEHAIYPDSYIVFNDIPKGAPQLAYLPVYGMNSRYAYILLTDLQGNQTPSNVVKIPNPTLIPILSDYSCLQNDQFDLTLKSAEMVSGYGYGIKCIYTLKNHSKDPQRLTVQNVCINSHGLNHYKWRATTIEPGEENEIVVYIDGTEIQQTGIKEAYSIEMVMRIEHDNDHFDDYSISIPVQLDTAIFSRISE